MKWKTFFIILLLFFVYGYLQKKNIFEIRKFNFADSRDLSLLLSPTWNCLYIQNVKNIFPSLNIYISRING